MSNQKILLDPEWVTACAKHSWYISASGYAASRISGKIVYMHKMILPHNSHVDHVNGNKLDNRLSNLRKASPVLNAMNRPKQSNNTSGYKGVVKMRDKWQAKLRGVCIGTYSSKEQAALMYDIEAKKKFGEFAQLNFNLELT